MQIIFLRYNEYHQTVANIDMRLHYMMCDCFAALNGLYSALSKVGQDPKAALVVFDVIRYVLYTHIHKPSIHCIQPCPCCALSI